MEPRLSQFGPSLGWLLSKEVSASRLADLFQTTPENIRVIAFRARHAVAPPEGEEHSLQGIPLAELPARLGVRQGPDEVVRTPAKTRALDEIRNDITETLALRAADYRYLEGVRELRKLLPKIGFAGDARRIALSALLHQHMAWLFVHGGRCDSAAREARMARELWRVAYRESPERGYADGFVQSALIGSHAQLLIRRPERAWNILDIAEDGARAVGAPLGSDHFRQRGVALFQLREDERAAAYFENAARAMERMNEARVPAQLLMIGLRHTSLLKSNYDGSLEVLNAATRGFGQSSLEASMALHWTAASGLLTDSTSVNQNAIDLLRAASEPSAQFGHQLTIRKLLALTPDLGLDLRLRRMWVRRALYENAFRNS